MKIYLMTDLEGVAGVMNSPDWCLRDGRYYETAKTLLTLEANAAIEGFMEEGATEIIVADGHGPGALDIQQLDPRAKLMRGWPGRFPFLLDDSYDAVAWVGQHAKAGTEYSHLAHTQGFSYLNLSVNGVSIGELGQFAMCASELGVPAIFAAGEKALCAEAEALIPGIVTTCVKEGTTPGTGDECSEDEYRSRNAAAIHLQPRRSRELIKAGARAAIRQARGNASKPNYGIVPLEKPFTRETTFRHDERNPKRRDVATHPDSVIAMFNLPFEAKPMTDA